MDSTGKSQQSFVVRAQQIFEEALARPPEQRAEFLEQACGDDSKLRVFVDDLVAADLHIGEGTLSPSQDNIAQVLVEESVEQLIGSRFGEFKIVSLLGRGGMGSVYLAEREHDGLKQRVALKLLLPERVGTDAVRRFQVEQQILANLKHPFIAHLYSSGTSKDGVPFYAMEYVQGQRLFEYCDIHRLDIRQRLDLFCDICLAVDYAHRNLVVHRDIKSSNILVDENGKPKLLDFGIAKPLVGNDPEVTRTELRFVSLSNAAPEQLSGQAVGVACDIYQLGILLYEMLAGAPPFDLTGSTLSTIENQVLNYVPTIPSEKITDTGQHVISARGVSSHDKLRQALQGDIDAIVSKCLRKEPEERYHSAGMLKEDLQRWKNNQPISARHDDRMYRLGKFVRRNRWSIAGVSMFTIVTLGFVVALAVQSINLAAQRDLATAERNRAENVADFLIDAFEAADPTQTQGEEVLAVDVLKQSAMSLRRSDDVAPQTRASLLATLARVQLNLGSPEDARESASLAVQIATQLDDQALVIEAMMLQASAQIHSANLEEAKELVDSIATRVTPGTEAAYRHQILYGGLLFNMDQRQDAIRIYEDVVNQVHGEDKLTVLEELGAYYRSQQDFDIAQKYYDQALELEGQLGNRPHRIGRIYNQLSILHRRTQDYDKALEDSTRAYEVLSAVYGEEHYIMAGIFNSIANIHARMDQYETAITWFQKAIQVLEATIGTADYRYAMTLNNLAGTYSELNQYALAEEHYLKALETGGQVWEPDHRNLGFFWWGLGHALTEQSKFARAEEALTKARANLVKKKDEGQYTLNGAMLDGELGYLRMKQGRNQEALALMEKSMQLLEQKMAEDNPDLMEFQERLATLRQRTNESKVAGGPEIKPD